MAGGVPESDWRIFRELREVALDRFCKRILDEVRGIVEDGSRDHHERYLLLFRTLREHDDEVARGFDDPRRSRMVWQLAWIHSLRLLQPEELERFTPETREAIEWHAEEHRR